MQRGMIRGVAGNNKVVAEHVARVRQDLRDLWHALRDDPKKHAGNKRAWSLLSGALTAATAIVARRAAVKIWMRLTGELPPSVLEAEKEAAKLRKEMSA